MSRKITVDGEVYRYGISTTRLDNDANFSLNLSVQEDRRGKKTALVVEGLVTRDYWIDLASARILDRENYAILLPRHVAAAIKRGLAAGWQPHKPGKSFRLRVSWEDLGGCAYR